MSVPVQYQQGKVEFLGFNFSIDPRALIPRFETEFLVRHTIEWCLSQSPSRSWRVIDIGTGSGIIPISLVRALPLAQITAIDRSADALALARENALRHDVSERISFVQGDLLTGLQDNFDVILANLPYLPTGRISNLDSSVRDFEPHQALDGGADGFDLYRKLLDQIAALPKLPSLCIFEFDDGQEEIAKNEITARLPAMHLEILKDSSDLYRYIILKPQII